MPAIRLYRIARALNRHIYELVDSVTSCCHLLPEDGTADSCGDRNVTYHSWAHCIQVLPPCINKRTSLFNSSSVTLAGIGRFHEAQKSSINEPA